MTSNPASRRAPPDRYARWLATPIGGISDGSFVPAWAIGLILLSAVTLIVVTVGRLTGLVPGLAVGASLMALGLLLIRAWLIATARVHRYLLTRSDLSDVLRVGLLVIAASALVIAVVAAFAVIAVGTTLLARIWREFAGA